MNCTPRIKALPAPAGFGRVIFSVVTEFSSMPVATCWTRVGVADVTAVTLIESAWPLPDIPLESVGVAVKLYMPTVNAVPAIVHFELSVSPESLKLPEVSAQLMGAVPPVVASVCE